MAKDETQVGEEAEPNFIKDRWGNERRWEGEKYPDGSPAHEGHITKPSGQGGASPKTRPDHQDMFPANPPPDEQTLEYADRLRRQEQGEDVDLAAPLTATKGSRSSKSEESKGEGVAEREARTARVASKDSPK
jgi:hypothetical protein